MKIAYRNANTINKLFTYTKDRDETKVNPMLDVYKRQPEKKVIISHCRKVDEISINENPS